MSHNPTRRTDDAGKAVRLADAEQRRGDKALKLDAWFRAGGCWYARHKPEVYGDAAK